MANHREHSSGRRAVPARQLSRQAGRKSLVAGDRSLTISDGLSRSARDEQLSRAGIAAELLRECVDEDVVDVGFEFVDGVDGFVVEASDADFVAEGLACLYLDR